MPPRSPDVSADGQPPALPPKQCRKSFYAQVTQAHSQQELDNHVSEMYDVPAVGERNAVRAPGNGGAGTAHWHSPVPTHTALL